MNSKEKNSFSPIGPDLINKTVQDGDAQMDDEEPKVSNIVMFPGTSRNRPPQSFEEICKHVELAKTSRIEDVTEIVIINLFEDLYENNYDFTERPDVNKEMAFLIEAVRSVMHKHDGLDHPFHSMAEELFGENDDGELVFLKETK